jgi:hypothetical protein
MLGRVLPDESSRGAHFAVAAAVRAVIANEESMESFMSNGYSQIYIAILSASSKVNGTMMSCVDPLSRGLWVDLYTFEFCF